MAWTNINSNSSSVEPMVQYYDYEVPEAPIQMLPPRSKFQMEVMGGWIFTLATSIILVFFLIGTASASLGPGFGVFSLFAILPGVLLVAALYFTHSREISFSLLLETTICGATISAAIASFIELVGITRTQGVWECASHPERPTGVLCSILFAIVVVVTVGAAQELAKIVPLVRIKTKESDVPYTCPCWWRLSEGPIGLLLAGCSSGVGFACAENLRYILTRSSLEKDVATALFRTFTTVPLHVATTGYIAGRWAALKFTPYDSLNGNAFPQTTSMSLVDHVAIMGVPTVLHGLYDAAALLSHSTDGSATKPQSAKAVLPVISILTLTIIIVLFANQWRILAVTFRPYQGMSRPIGMVAQNVIDVEGQQLMAPPSMEAVDGAYVEEYVPQNLTDCVDCEYIHDPRIYQTGSPVLSFSPGGVELSKPPHDHGATSATRTPLQHMSRLPEEMTVPTSTELLSPTKHYASPPPSPSLSPY